ncbi:MAG: carboxy terminal-processing peptidase [Schleiferiaceae bacterium]
MVVAAAGLFFGFKAYQSSGEKEMVINELIYSLLTTQHYQPKALNDDLSEGVYDLYFETLDYNKRFFTAPEMEAWSKESKQLDNYFSTNNLSFFDKTYVTFTERLDEVQTMVGDILSEPLDLETEAYLETDPEKLDWAADKGELEARWRKYLTYRVASRVYSKQEEMREALEQNDTTVAQKSLEELEANARKRETEVHNDWFATMKTTDRVEWLGAYMNAWTGVFDPHTEYLPPAQQDNFEIDMSGQLEGIGATLSSKGSYVTVERIVSGSPCWKQGDLEVGDKITKVAQGDDEPVDVVGMNINKVVKLIRGKKGTEVRLTVKKKDGSRMIIPIIRDVVELEQTFAKSAVLGEGEDRVGYIKLPRFYVDFYSENNRNCAEDVKKELIQFTNEGIDDLIIDLRNNGGGSLPGVNDMIGLFIPEGPVVQVKSNQQGIKKYYDEDKKSYWGGNVVVLVNEFSASASEIFASAIQDYNRGIIVGSSSTYGKGTVQNIYDMDRALGAQYNRIKPIGAVKLTIQKYYRINGNTTQLKGVVPDIVLPDSYNYMDFGEREQTYALASDKIPAAKYTPYDYDFSDAIEASEDRVKDNEKFATIDRYAKRLKEKSEETQVGISLAQYRAEEERAKEEGKQYEGMNRTSDTLTVSAFEYQKAAFGSDSTKLAGYNRWLKNISTDLYLHEAVDIVHDIK